MERTDGRAAHEMRTAVITRGFMPDAEGSCLVEIGNTRVICTATVEDKAPIFTKGTGWINAEYGLLPRSTPVRSPREVKTGVGERTMEVQRLIARSLRTAIDMPVLGHRTITIDCDVLQSDGGASCAALTGGYIVLAEACRRLVEAGTIHRMPLNCMVASVQVGIVGESEWLDPNYMETRRCLTSLNIVGTDKGRYVEVQGGGGSAPFDRKQLARLLDLAKIGIDNLVRVQKEALADIL